MDGLDKFYSGLTKAFVEIYLPVIETQREVFESNFSVFLHDESISEQKTIKLSNNALFVQNIHQGVFEILSSYESLLDAELYIRRFPYTETRITRMRHLRYVFENYLNEIYILKVRLIAYTKAIEEFYAIGNRRKKVRQITQPLFTFTSNFFKEFVAERGEHVHSRRYDSVNISRLEAMERLSTSNPSTEWASHMYNYFELVYKDTRKNKSKEIQDHNQKIKNLLDSYFEKLYPVLFDSDGNLLMPK